MNITFSRISTAQRALGGHERLAAPRDANAKLGVKPNSLAAAKPSGSLASLVGLGRTLPRQDEGASFPPLPAESILKPVNTIDALADVSPTVAIAQATIDFLKVLSAIGVVVVTGVGIGVSAFYFLFL
jgi:hypothetical protein